MNWINQNQAEKLSWVLLLFAALIFVSFKWDALFLPYFWDEAWSYIPAIDAMITAKPCLMPDCIDTELYRGHPLLFYFLSSGWAVFFGDSFFSLHSFAMVISFLAIAAFYRLGRLVLSPYAAVVGCALLMLQAVFYVQSSFVLPEILLLFFTLEMFYGYLKNKYWHFVIFSALICLTKESGLIILAGFGIYELLQIIKNRNFKATIPRLIWIGLPVIPMLLFFIYQKIKLGWFFFPLHTGMIDLSSEALLTKSKIILNFLFYKQGRWILWAILHGITLLKIFKTKSNIWKIPFSVCLIIGLIMVSFENRFGTLFFIIPCIFYYLKHSPFNELEKKLLNLSFVIAFLFAVFSAANFLMLRYLLCILPIILVFFLLPTFKSISKKPVYTLFIGLLLMTGFLINNYNNARKGWHDDASLNYYNVVKVHQELIAYCEAENLYERDIYTHFLMWHNLTKPALGYLSSEKIFEKVNHTKGIQAHPEFVIFSTVELNYKRYTSLKENPDYRLLKRFEFKSAWGEVYSRKQNEFFNY